MWVVKKAAAGSLISGCPAFKLLKEQLFLHATIGNTKFFDKVNIQVFVESVECGLARWSVESLRLTLRTMTVGGRGSKIFSKHYDPLPSN